MSHQVEIIVAQTAVLGEDNAIFIHFYHPQAITIFMGINNNHKKMGWFTLWLFNIAMENGPFIGDVPIKTSIYRGFSMAMLVITRWYVVKMALF